jgi:hypothetical protein
MQGRSTLRQCPHKYNPQARSWVPHPQVLEGAGLDSTEPEPSDDHPVTAIVSQIATLDFTSSKP